ncbi:MAG: DUF4124 domain-containing protein [Sinimarinibacterium flocculans]|uniref:DUF4124 domain-containing protein n=1 Tax=Sinimarinibacterium flocculans TaxID=985250 RepID=UPI003C6BA0A7
MRRRAMSPANRNQTMLMKYSPVIALLLALASTPALAGPYKCRDKTGALKFQDTPCSGTQAPVDYAPKPLDSTPRGASTSEFGWVRSVSSPSSSSSDPRFGKFGLGCEDMPQADRQSLIGIEASKLKELCGWPSDVNRTVTAQGAREQWVYRESSGAKFIYVINGRVRSFQE